ncbi:MAG: hypothetical protein K2K86_01325, partial [Muribaculaceae bacterium]|nr:hypothetical protein [Muribaculaceae bacterium]
MKKFKSILTLIVMSLGCVSTVAAGEKTVTFEPDSTRVLRNPLQGWVMDLGRPWDEKFWTERGYDSMKVPGRDETVKVSDYA